MHALVGVWSVAPGTADVHNHELETRIVPMVRDLPGFVHAFWAEDAETGKVHSFIVFDDEAAVRRLKRYLENNSPRQAKSGISYDSLSIVEVKSSAFRQQR